MISFIKAVRNFYVKAFNFKGRATRAEYWWAYLYMLLFVVAYYVLIFIVVENSMSDSYIMIATLLLILHLIPIISLYVRRLHDFGASGAGVLICFIPVIGTFFQLMIGLRNSVDDNKYGPKVSYEPKKEDNEVIQ
ncbi:MAG: DUF805 domain-containing protein [Bacteroidaceae bacterium]|nr:DUF805 domain-containing protein [Bacteroidaceae bacterium]